MHKPSQQVSLSLISSPSRSARSPISLVCRDLPGQRHDLYALVLVHACMWLDGLGLVTGQHHAVAVNELHALHVAVDLLAVLVAGEVEHLALAHKLHLVPVKLADPQRRIFLADHRHTAPHVAVERHACEVQELGPARHLDHLLHSPLAVAIGGGGHLGQDDAAMSAVQTRGVGLLGGGDDGPAVVALTQRHEVALPSLLKVVHALNTLVGVLKRVVEDAAAHHRVLGVVGGKLELLGL
mmetsp:Transcript_5417/g.11971  ORF Transcript_5417/g.11971 Transcript_5417/m.11971 type:complete len:239 (+) Transcript_5417:667-1383(+)